MASMGTLTLDEVRAIVYETLNLSKNVAYGTFDNSPLYKVEYIRDLIFDADDSVVSAICQTVGHPRRSEYTYQQGLGPEGVVFQLSTVNDAANRGVLNVDITRADLSIVPGIPAPAEKIGEWVRNKSSYGGSDCTDGYYNIQDGQFIFSGGGATLTLLNVADHTSADTNLFSPPEYKNTIVKMALGDLFGKDPAKRDLGARYYQEAMDDIKMIMANVDFVPAFTQHEQER